MRASGRKSGSSAARGSGGGGASASGDLRTRALHHRWLQRKAQRGGANAPAASDAQLAGADQSPGERVEEQVQRKVEKATGADLSGVRVHTGAASAEAAAAVQARAYTVGHDVHFGAGQYQPHTREGQHLLLHELVHTVQQGSQGGKPKPQHKLEVSQPGDDAEREADQLADHIVDGKAGGEQSVRQAPRISRAPMVQREAEGALPGGVKEPIVAKLDINADVETADRTKLTMKELKNAQVGHAWISLRYNDPTQVPANIANPSGELLKGGGTAMGFWPLIHRAEEWGVDGKPSDPDMQARMDRGETPGAGASANPADRGFNLNPLKSYVPGRVEEPDTAHAAKGLMSYDLTQSQVDSLMGYVNSKRAAQYSLFFFNCTTFATQAVAAAGHAPPDASTMGICLPNALYKSILELKQEGNANAATTPLGPGEKEPAPKKK